MQIGNAKYGGDDTNDFEVASELLPLSARERYSPYLWMGVGLALVSVGFLWRLAETLAWEQRNVGVWPRPTMAQLIWASAFALLGVGQFLVGACIAFRQLDEFVRHAVSRVPRVKKMRQAVNVCVGLAVVSGVGVAYFDLQFLRWVGLISILGFVVLPSVLPLVARRSLASLDEDNTYPERLAPTYGIVTGVIAVLANLFPGFSGVYWIQIVVLSVLIAGLLSNRLGGLVTQLPRVTRAFIGYVFVLGLSVFTVAEQIFTQVLVR